MRFALLALAVLLETQAFGVHFGLGSLGGLMQMPNSSYYLAVYGGYGEIGTESQSLLLRAGYVERPKFRSEGFVDQDTASFFLLGTKLSKDKNHGFYAYLGSGEQRGYIASERDDAEDKRSSYSLRGLAAAVEYAWQLENFSFAANHQTFIGYANGEQFKANVVWPVSFFMLRMGYVL